ncbi:hydantoinase/oxoprolinase family protein [Burkholderia sp. BCC0419]|uniref:hydantoinase/oxoprolinase family protein n=1 Tax=Burkholderia sp. BCC0419 TaxID=486878 RepID=UPI0015893D64|nr:hydantoinase/oxoprolinase family protein [Burkholderia sp. BCC0419]
MTAQRHEDLRVGIDVGGTNTDAVLMRGRSVVAALKQPTTASVGDGLAMAVRTLIAKSDVDPATIRAVMVGTTQFINAFLERRNLAKVATIRLSLPKTDGVPPMLAWSDDLRAAIGEHVYLAHGGAFFTGETYREIDRIELSEIAAEIRDKQIGSVAISANFAPIRPDIEQRAREMIREMLDEDVLITLSSDVGGIGLVERENAAIINACLRPFARTVINDMERAFRELGLNAPVYISQNDGTLISTSMAADFPIFTCSAGPTNSIRGAAFLTNIRDGLVVDVGGTTTDIGALVRGFPRETSGQNEIGGIRTNFRMPDSLSIAVGGGSLVRRVGGVTKIGPESVGYRISEEALVFGGSTLTATDIAVSARLLTGIGDPLRVAHLDDDVKHDTLKAITAAIEQAIDQMRTSAQPVPVVLVGGGSVLLPDSLDGASEVLRPEHFDVANAIGAAIAQVSGRVDRLFDMAARGRDVVLEEAHQLAIDDAVSAGADPATVEVVEVTELPMTHMRAGATRVRVRAVGQLSVCHGTSDNQADFRN